MKQITATVISNEKLWGESLFHGRQKFLGAWLMWLNCPEVASEAKPGQFIMADCGEECLLPRPFSIHQVTDEGIALFYAVLENGRGTVWLSQRKADDKVGILGALGNGFSINPHSNNLLLVAGGNGIAPLYFLAQEAIIRQCSVTLIHGASSKLNLYPEKMPSGIELVMVNEEDMGKKVTELLPQYIDWADQVFACGPLSMYKEMHRKKETLLKDKPVQVSLEVRMGCGLGVCYGCTVKTKKGLRQVCKDGPIFDLDDILWDELNC